MPTPDPWPQLIQRAAKNPVVVQAVDLILQDLEQRGLQPTRANIFETGLRLGLNARGALNMVEVAAVRQDAT
jgi:hypothetical protein